MGVPFGLASLKVYRDRRMLAILLMGFASGLPLALTGSTLAIRLKDVSISNTWVGYFALATLPYTLKFLWAPIMDRVALPHLTARWGRRRSWALTIEILLMLAILALGFVDPAHSIGAVAILALLVAFLSASQDVVIDAFRVELLGETEQGAGAAATQIGYRLAIIASGAGALYLAHYLDWVSAYLVMAALMPLGMVGVFMSSEPRLAPVPAPATLEEWLGKAVIDPFADFMKRRGFLVILVFIVLYKFGDALAGVMSSPFYVDLGFSKPQIASVTKIFGIIASMAGVFLGGLLVARVGVFRGLMAAGVLQMLANLVYLVQLGAGADVEVLAFTIAVENVTTGMGSAAFVAYLSSLCSPAFTATQYALFSALAAVPRTLLVAPGGSIADHLGWGPFFVLATLLCLPGLGVLWWLSRSARAAPGYH